MDKITSFHNIFDYNEKIIDELSNMSLLKYFGIYVRVSNSVLLTQDSFEKISN